MFNKIYIYLIPLLITIFIESIFYFAFLKNKNIKNMFLILLINLITNPVLNLIYINTGYNFYILMGLEIAVVIIEGLYFYFISKSKISFLISFIANLGSYLIGFLFNNYLYFEVYQNLYLINLTLLVLIEYLIFLILIVKRNKK